jgi:hypothetical protein
MAMAPRIGWTTARIIRTGNKYRAQFVASPFPGAGFTLCSDIFVRSRKGSALANHDEPYGAAATEELFTALLQSVRGLAAVRCGVVHPCLIDATVPVSVASLNGWSSASHPQVTG